MNSIRLSNEIEINGVMEREDADEWLLYIQQCVQRGKHLNTPSASHLFPILSEFLTLHHRSLHCRPV